MDLLFFPSFIIWSTILATFSHVQATVRLLASPTGRVLRVLALSTYTPKRGTSCSFAILISFATPVALAICLPTNTITILHLLILSLMISSHLLCASASFEDQSAISHGVSGCLPWPTNKFFSLSLWSKSKLMNARGFVIYSSLLPTKFSSD